jgi:hypothetical protein
MVRSLAYDDLDDRKEPGRRLTNMELGMVMLAQLAESIEQHRPRRNNQTNVAEKVEALIRVARQKARATGRSLGQVLREHRDALEDGGRNSRFLLNTSGSGDRPSASAGVHAAMALQDQRRAEEQPSAMMQMYGEEVERQTGHLVPVPVETSGPKYGYQTAEERADALRPPSHVATHTGVTRPPAQRHTQGGQNPNADHLRLMEPPRATPGRKTLTLMHNPSSGGGMHNPVSFDDEPAPAGPSGAPERSSGRTRKEVNYREEDVPNQGGDTYGSRREGKKPKR